MRALSAVVAVSLILLHAVPVAAQTPPVNVDVTGRMQFQFNSTSVSEIEAGPLAATTFETRRVRLAARITVGDWIEGEIEPEYALGSLQLKNAWVSLELDPAFVIRAGQFKKPFGAIELSSSTAQPMIERGVRIRGLDDALLGASTGQLSLLRDDPLIGEHYALLDRQGYSGRDLGFTLEGAAGGLGWSAGLFNGNGADERDENDTKSLAARVTYSLSTATPVRIGAAWSRRDLRWPEPESDVTRTGDAFAIDAELGGFRRGWWALAEVASGTNLATEERFLGAQAVLARFIATGGARIEGIEPMARVSYGDPDDSISDDAGMLLTPGVNLYFFGRNRLMFNWDVFVPEGSQFDTQHAGRAQINLYF